MIRNRRAVPALTRAVGDADERVRWYALLALTQVGDVAAVPAVTKALNDSRDAVRSLAIQVLGSLGDPTPIPSLTTCLKANSSDERARAAEALGKIRDPSAVPALIDAAIDNANNAVRRQALIALERIGEGQSLLLILLSDPNTDASGKLDRLHALQDIPQFYLPPVREYCQRTADSTEFEDPIRKGAAAVLTEIDNRIAAVTLVRASARACNEGQELLRAESGSPSAAPADEHVRPSEKPANEKKPSRSWFRRR